uniref:Uncharacterized protein n=1 Tax=Tetranychus urticae TaxID=32264 RepID=T1KYK3_TETUR
MFGKDVNQQKKSSSSEPNNNESISRDESPRKKSKISRQKEKEIPCDKETVEYFLVVIVPLVLDIHEKDINQPVMIKISNQLFLDLDLNINQNFDLEDEMNLFFFRLKNKRISFRIIASGASSEVLKRNLSESIKQNQALANLKKIINFSENFIKIEQDPSAIMGEKLPYICMSQEEFSSLFKKEKKSKWESLSNSDETLDTRSNDHCVDDDDDDEASLPSVGENSEIKARSQKTKSTKEIDTQREESKRISYDCKLEKIQNVNAKLTEMKRQKMLLSEVDLSGIIIKSLIDIVSDIFELMELTDEEKEIGCNKVPEKDQTYKEIDKNRIFIEGMIELNLDAYEKAINQAKPNNACSIAYQLVRFAFPESYVNRVTLGKKNYTHAELASYDGYLDRGGNEEKIPLAYVFSFPDPFNEPNIGEFDPILGKKRLSCFFDHVFRRAGYEKYNEEQANKVRSRVIKELCSRNKDKESGQNNSKDQKQSDNSDNSDKIDSNILESDIFSKD